MCGRALEERGGVDMAVERCVVFVIFRIFLVFLVVVFGRDQEWGTNWEDRALKLKSLLGVYGRRDGG